MRRISRICYRALAFHEPGREEWACAARWRCASEVDALAKLMCQRDWFLLARFTSYRWGGFYVSEVGALAKLICQQN